MHSSQRENEWQVLHTAQFTNTSDIQSTDMHVTCHWQHSVRKNVWILFNISDYTIINLVITAGYQPEQPH